MIIVIREYLDAQGRSPYARWFDSLNARAAAKIAMALYRMEAGNLSGIKGVGGGVFERKLDFGPGYRVYFGKDGDTLVILLGGSSKARQSEAIAHAQACWLGVCPCNPPYRVHGAGGADARRRERRAPERFASEAATKQMPLRRHEPGGHRVVAARLLCRSSHRVAQDHASLLASRIRAAGTWCAVWAVTRTHS